jgi:hypothetical protein
LGSQFGHLYEYPTSPGIIIVVIFQYLIQTSFLYFSLNISHRTTTPLRYLILSYPSVQSVSANFDRNRLARVSRRRNLGLARLISFHNPPPLIRNKPELNPFQLLLLDMLPSPSDVVLNASLESVGVPIPLSILIRRVGISTHRSKSQL